jgi:hypothetical protein
MADEQRTDIVFEQLLVADFNQCFQHIRYYEEWFRRLIEFNIGLTFAVLAAYAAVIGRYGRTGLALTIGSLLCGCAAVGGVFVITALSRTRVHLALVCRFVNEIRSAYVAIAPAGFKNTTGMWTDYSRPHNYDPDSTHVIGIYFVALLNAVLFATCVVTMPAALLMMEVRSVAVFSVKYAAPTGFLFLALQIIMVRVYWWKHEAGSIKGGVKSKHLSFSRGK